MTDTPVVRASARGATLVLVAILAGAAVAVALGVFGRYHTPESTSLTLGFDSVLQLKVWLALVVGILALGQLVGALWLYGRLGLAVPRWLGKAHRAGGVATVLVSLPIAYNCLWALGFQSTDGRVLAHSLLGCLVYGALVTKVFAVESRHGPSWFLPVAGGVLFTAFIGVVATSALWYLQAHGAPGAAGY